MEKKTYTEAIHAKGLLEILKEEHTCRSCPTNVEIINSVAVHGWNNNPCEVCHEFINLSDRNCPCNILGEEAIEITYEQLEMKGYI